MFSLGHDTKKKQTYITYIILGKKNIVALKSDIKIKVNELKILK